MSLKLERKNFGQILKMFTSDKAGYNFDTLHTSIQCYIMWGKYNV